MMVRSKKIATPKPLRGSEDLPALAGRGSQMIVIGVDPGTKCGWAVLKKNRGGVSLLDSGVWELKRAKGGAGARFLMVRKNLLDTIRTYEWCLADAANGSDTSLVVAYERPGDLMGEAILVLNGIVAIIEMTCEGRGTGYLARSPSQVKRAAGVPGNAPKEVVSEAIERLYPPNLDARGSDENDAIACALAGLEELSK